MAENSYNNALKAFPEGSKEWENLQNLANLLNLTGDPKTQAVYYTVGTVDFHFGFNKSPMCLNATQEPGWACTTLIAHDPKEPIDSPSESWLVLTPDEQRIAVYGNLQDQRKLRDTIRKRKKNAGT